MRIKLDHHSYSCQLLLLLEHFDECYHEKSCLVPFSFWKRNLACVANWIKFKTHRSYNSLPLFSYDIENMRGDIDRVSIKDLISASQSSLMTTEWMKIAFVMLESDVGCV